MPHAGAHNHRHAGRRDQERHGVVGQNESPEVKPRLKNISKKTKKNSKSIQMFQLPIHQYTNSMGLCHEIESAHLQAAFRHVSSKTKVWTAAEEHRVQPDEKNAEERFNCNQQPTINHHQST